MTPGKFIIPFFKGAKWEHTFRFLVTGTATPVNLTGLGPFVMEVKNLSDSTVLATATATSAYDATGEVVFSLIAAQTLTFPIGRVKVGIRDNLNNPYAQGRPDVLEFTPDPE